MPNVFPDSAVFQRTTKGQREIIFPSEQLPPHAKRLLLLVNGFTPFGDFTQRMQGKSFLVEELTQLVDGGYVAIAPLAKVMAARGTAGNVASWASDPVPVSVPVA